MGAGTKNGKVVKGQYGYIKNRQKTVTVRTILMFGLSLAVFGMGIWSTGDKKNLLTIVAVLGCLPASKSAVNMIMFLKAKGCSQKVKEQTETYSAGLTQLYDMVFTSYEKNYQVSHMVIKGHVVCGYTEDGKCDVKACEKHLDMVLKQGGCKGATVKIYDRLEDYCSGLGNLQKQEAEPVPEEILINLLAVSL